MNKPIRKAVRCYLIKDNKIVVTRYKSGNKKEGYYDIPGGKIEEGETPEQTAVREMKEETGLDINNPIYKGNMIIEYPNRIFDFDVFICNECEGEPKEYEENTSEWIAINELLQKEKILSNIMILDRFFIKGLVDNRYRFEMHIKVDEKENILNVKYSLDEITDETGTRANCSKEGLLIHKEEYKYLFKHIRNKNIRIRKCNIDDVDSIYDIQNIVIDKFKEEEKGYFLPFKKEIYLRIVNDPINDGEIYGAFIDDKMIAWIFLSVSNRMKELKQMIPNLEGSCADIDGSYCITRI